MFEIRYKPGYHLRVRMGVHLGPCMSGLTGTDLPLYTMIGDGTEMAWLMESTSDPMKVQVIIDK